MMAANPVRGMGAPWQQPGYMAGRNQFGQMMATAPQGWAAENARRQAIQMASGRTPYVNMEVPGGRLVSASTPNGYTSQLPGMYQTIMGGGDQYEQFAPGQFRENPNGAQPGMADTTPDGMALRQQALAQARTMGQGMAPAGATINPSFAARKAAYAGMSPQAPNLAQYANPALASDPALQARRAYSAYQVANDPARQQRQAQAQQLQNVLARRLRGTPVRTS